jgi:hypothetical protein
MTFIGIADGIPHPVRALLPGAKLRKRVEVIPFLRFDESIQSMRQGSNPQPLSRYGSTEIRILSAFEANDDVDSQRGYWLMVN